MEQSPLWEFTSSPASQKFSTFYGTQRFITVFWRSHHLSLFWDRFIQSMLSCSVSLRSVVIISSHWHSGLLSGCEAPHFFIFLQPVITGSHYGVNEMLSFWILYTVWSGSFLLAFQNNLSIQPSSVNQDPWRWDL